MNSEKHVEQELIAYLDGEVSAVDETRINNHLMTCESCRAALEELRLVRQDLGTTLDKALSPVRLSQEADERIRQVIQTRLERRPLWWQSLWQRRGLFSQAVMAIFIVLMSVTALRVVTPSAPVPVHETIVLGQDQFAPGSQGALRVVVQSLGSALPSAVPIPGAEVIVSLSRATGAMQRLYSGQTDNSGSAEITFIVPDNIQGDAELIVETTSTAGTERIVRPIHIKRSHKIYLGSDKPTYRPGQTLYLRALVMDAVESIPASDESLTFQVLDGKKQIIYEKEVNLSNYGVGFTEYHLRESAQIGNYTIRASVGDTVVERTIEVNLYPPPAFHITLETAESYGIPGDVIHGSVACSYFFGKPVQGSVRIIAYAGEHASLPEIKGILDEEGVFRFTLDLPDTVDEDSLTIVASVLNSAGHIEGIQRDLTLSASPILIKAIPESGRLKSGVENIIYLATVYPDGSPAKTDLQLIIDEKKYKIQTDAFGLALFRFTPQADTDLYLVARDADGHVAEETISLAADADVRSMLLRADQAAYTVGETLVLEALVAAENVTHVYLDVVRSGQTAAVLSAPVVDHTAVFALDLDGSLTGALNLRAYALSGGSVIVEDSRLVVVDPAGSLDITVKADQTSHRPADTAHLQLETAVRDRDSKQVPVQSVLGIAIVDTSVLSLEMLPPGFARTYFLMDDALIDRRGTLPGFDPPALLEGEETTRQAQDVAARAAWAGVQNVSYSTPSSVRVEGIDEGAVNRTRLAMNLSWLLILLPLGTCVLVVQGLLPSGVFWRACRRLGWGLLALTALSPVLIAGLVIGLLLPWLGAGLAAVMVFIITVLLIGLMILSWVHHDVRLQLTVVLVGVYVAAAVFVLILMAMTADTALENVFVVILTTFFLVLLTSLFVLGQGFVLEGRRLDGWLISLLVVLLILLAISLPGVPKLNSNFSRTISNPYLYSGPIGWLSGCAPLAMEPAETEAPSAEKETEATEMPAATPSPMPTAVPQLPGTATPVTVPLEPYPVRQLFPETLYWAPDVETNSEGAVNLDIQMADSFTTWRLTALGSTKNGDIGAASYDLRVFQDFFVDVVVDDVLEIDHPSSLTLTVYNYLDTAQTVRWEIEPSEDYVIETAPSALRVGADSVASITFEIIPLQAGEIVLDVKSTGDSMVDIIRVKLDVSVP